MLPPAGRAVDRPTEVPVRHRADLPRVKADLLLDLRVAAAVGKMVAVAVAAAETNRRVEPRLLIM